MEIRFKLNPKNEKDKVIIDILSGEYSPSETIKNILYKMGMDGLERHPVSVSGQKKYDDISKNGVFIPESDIQGEKMGRDNRNAVKEMLEYFCE